MKITALAVAFLLAFCATAQAQQVHCTTYGALTRCSDGTHCVVVGSTIRCSR